MSEWVAGVVAVLLLVVSLVLLAVSVWLLVRTRTER